MDSSLRAVHEFWMSHSDIEGSSECRQCAEVCFSLSLSLSVPFSPITAASQSIHHSLLLLSNKVLNPTEKRIVGRKMCENRVLGGSRTCNPRLTGDSLTDCATQAKNMMHISRPIQHSGAVRWGGRNLEKKTIVTANDNNVIRKKKEKNMYYSSYLITCFF